MTRNYPMKVIKIQIWLTGKHMDLTDLGRNMSLMKSLVLEQFHQNLNSLPSQASLVCSSQAFSALSTSSVFHWQRYLTLLFINLLQQFSLGLFSWCVSSDNVFSDWRSKVSGGWISDDWGSDECFGSSWSCIFHCSSNESHFLKCKSKSEALEHQDYVLIKTIMCKILW